MDTQPQTIGPYRLLEPLGRGGMGVVYRALHPDGRVVALKTVHLAAETQLASLRREIHALARLRHPGIVRILDEGVTDGLPWYAMELLEGLTLRRHAARLGLEASTGQRPMQPQAALPESPEPRASVWWTLTLGTHSAGAAPIPEPPELGPEATAGAWGAAPSRLRELLDIVRRLCAPLAYLHGEGLVHCDLKLDNILVRPDGNPVVVDFGLATRFGGEVSREAVASTSFTAGTASTMAPEQIRGELLDARADLYALGCILYELLCGRPPYVGEVPAYVLWQHLNAQPEPPSLLVRNVPAPLEALILRLLAKDPRERLGHAADLAAALGRLWAEDRPAPKAAGFEEGPRPQAYLYRPSFAGREEPLSELEAHLESLEKGHGALVLVGGPSGIGKTRLLLELARRAERRKIRVFSGECASVNPAEGAGARISGALQPLRRTLNGLADCCRESGAEMTERLLGRRGKVLALYEPALRGLPGQERHAEPVELPAEAARLRLYSDLAESLWALSEEQPLILVLDDLQWADELTLGFLGYLAQAASRGAGPARRLLVLGTYRSEELGEGLRALLKLRGARQLRLERLNEKAVGQMVCDMLALSQSPVVFARYLSRHSEGNPFFVAEYLRTAVQEGLLWRDETGSWIVAEEAAEKATEEAYERLPLPQSIRELVARHLKRLGGAAQKLVEAASVLGKQMEGSLLAAVSGAGAVEVLEGTLKLLGQQVMEEASRGSLRFVHNKLREVAYQQLSEPRRVELHRAAAEALQALHPEKRDERLAALGHHWEQAGVAVKAREAYLDAARKAKARFAYAEAARLYGAHLRLVEEPTPESIEARNELGGDILGVQGRMDEAVAEHQKALEEARRIGHRRSEAESLRAMGRVVRNQGRLEPALELHKQALDIAKEVGDRQLEGRVLGNLAICQFDQGRLDEARALLQGEIEIHRENGNRRAEGGALGTLAIVSHFGGSVEEARGLYEQALAIQHETGNRLAEGNSLSNLALFHAYQGRNAEAEARFEQALAIHREVGNRRSEAITLSNLAGLLSELEQPDRSVALYEEALAINRQIADRRSEGSTLGRLGDLYREMGRLEEARDFQGRAIALLREVQDPRNEALTLVHMGTLERQTGSDLALAQRLLEQGEAMVRDAQASFELALTLCARGHLALAQQGSARAHLEELERLAVTLGARPESEIGRSIGLLRRSQDAFDAGQHERLFRGELIQEIPEDLRRWLVQTGRLASGLAMLPARESI